MKRRDLIKTGGIALIGIASSSGQTRPSQNLPFGLEEESIAGLQAKMRSGEISSREIAQAYLKRIENLDKSLSSVIEINPDALEIAESLDKERKAGNIRSQLHGIPILIKDNIDTADKMLTTAGSLALTDNFAPKDAFVVSQLRRSGALLLGKTNLSEWANFRSSRSSSGWSGRGGQTRNPYLLDRSPCGSSSGTGAAISANLAAGGIGTETDGSIVCPSSSCGLVGIKPTVGLISRSGIIPISHTQDTAGPMTRSVADAAIMLGALAGRDAADSATAKAQKVGATAGYTEFLKTGLKGIRIGIARQFFGKNAAVDKIIESGLAELEKNGAALKDIKIPSLGKFDSDEYEVLLYEFKAGLNKYLSSAATKYKSLKQLIDFNEENAGKEMPYFKQEIFLAAQAKGGLNDRKYRIALQKCQTLSKAGGIDLAMDQNKLDAIAAPTGGPAWMTDLVNGDCGSAYIGSSSLAAVAGYPAITVPAGMIGGLPFGISFFGRAWSEGTLINIGYSFEQATKARQAPLLLRDSFQQ